MFKLKQNYHILFALSINNLSRMDYNINPTNLNLNSFQFQTDFEQFQFPNQLKLYFTQQVTKWLTYNIFLSMNKFCRNQSAETVPRNAQLLTLLINNQKKDPIAVTLKGSDTVGDLIDTVKERLKHQHMIGLCSYDGHFTLDYALQNRETKLSGIRNNQMLDVLFQGIVTDYNEPTLADFEFLACIGQGISAAVYLVRHCSNGKLYALKQIKKDYFTAFKTLESVLREKKILSQMVNDLPFVTKLEAAFQSYRHLNFLLQFYPGGQFFFHLTHLKLTEDQAKIYFAQILLTMEQLHQKKILYRDLKPENIMVDFEGHLRIGDFGLCRINLQKQDVAHTQCGSPEYMAYETKQSLGYGYAADFYTMGAIIYEMVKGVPPFYGNNPLQFHDVSESFKDLVLALIERDQSRRLTNYNQIKRSKWLRDIDWTKVMKKQYKLPTKLNLYTNYIHEQFLTKEIQNDDLRYEETYDKLMHMFFYMSDGKDSIAQYYPTLKGSQKSTHKQQKSKNSKLKKSQRSDKDGKSNKSDSKSRTSSKSKDLKCKGLIQNGFKRKPIKQANIYTSPPCRMNTEKDKHHDISNKSLSKSKQLQILSSNKSPLKFNKITNTKSSNNIKATQYIKEIDRNASKKKRFM